MSWSRVCDTAHGHPKFAEAGLEATGLWTLTLSHCGAYLTDGHVRRGAALRLAGSPEDLDRLAARLLRAGLWELHPSGDGWQVHDFLDFNPAKAHVVAEREAKSRAGRQTAAKRWGASADSSSNSSSVAPATRPATPLADAPVPIPSRSQIPSGEEIAPPAPLALSSEPPTGVKPKVRKPAKHTPEQIVAKNKVVEAFALAFESAKGVKPTLDHEADHAAAFALAVKYGPEEGSAIVTRALGDTWVLENNPTLRHIASKPDAWRGTAPPLAKGRGPRHAIQTDASWEGT